MMKDLKAILFDLDGTLVDSVSVIVDTILTSRMLLLDHYTFMSTYT